MLFEKYYKKLSIIFTLFLILIIFYSFDYSFGWGMKAMYPDIYIFTVSSGNSGYPSFIWNENGLVENIQAILLFITIILLIKIYKNVKNKSRTLKIFLFLNIFFISYVFLEEISWGQHYLNFETPNLLKQQNSFLYNKQNEFNLHNISSLFNEIPRNIVLIWCSLSIPLLKVFNIKKFNEFRIIIEPNKVLIYLSFIILIISIQETLIDKLNLIDGDKLYIFNENVFKEFNIKQLILNVMGFQFIRFSELQELLFFYYFFCHSAFLRNSLLYKKNNF